MPFWMGLGLFSLFVALALLVWRAIDRRATARRFRAYDAHVRGESSGSEFVAAQPVEPTGPLRYTGWAALGALALGVVCIFVSAYNPVGTKEEGILTSFGKTSGHLANGPHLTWPWMKLHQMDAAIQTDTFTDSDPTDDKCVGGVPVRIANNQTGCASISFQWRIVPSASEELYKDYRGFDHVRDALVTRRLKAAVNAAVAHYNPLDAIVFDTKQHAKQKTLAEFGKAVTRIMRFQVGNRIQVLSTIFTIITFDRQTQNRINQLQQQVALTRIAEQRYLTNTKEAEANRALATKSLSELVLVSRCLDTLEEMVKTHLAVPAGFSCWNGGGLAGVIAR